jgi:hypothetical protein
MWQCRDKNYTGPTTTRDETRFQDRRKTYMVKGVFFEWWFIIHINFHSKSNQEAIENELEPQFYC